MKDWQVMVLGAVAVVLGVVFLKFLISDFNV